MQVRPSKSVNTDMVDEPMTPEEIVNRVQCLPLFRGSRATLARETELSINTLNQERMSIRTRSNMIRFLSDKKAGLMKTSSEIDDLIKALSTIPV